MVKYLPELDLALLESDEDLCDIPFEIKDDFNFTVTEQLFFYGHDKRINNGGSPSLVLKPARVHSFGKVQSNGKLIDFVDFVGDVIPGYSGGPIINIEGKIVALIVTGNLRKFLKSGDAQVFTIGYSILPLF